MKLTIRTKLSDRSIETDTKKFEDFRIAVAYALDGEYGLTYEKAAAGDKQSQKTLAWVEQNNNFDREALMFLTQTAKSGEIDAKTCKKICEITSGSDLPVPLGKSLINLMQVCYERKQALVWEKNSVKG